MKCLTNILTALVLSMLVPTSGHASLIFEFNEVGGNVTMTASGVLDTNELIASSPSSWGGTGIQVASSYTIMGDTRAAIISNSFAFHDGTDFSAWTISSGPWSQDGFSWVSSGTTAFATYVFDSAFQVLPGFGLWYYDLVDGLWTPDVSWINYGQSFASLHMNVGSYTVSDAVTGESITFKVGDVSTVPVPAAAWLFGSGLVGLVGFTRRKLRA